MPLSKNTQTQEETQSQGNRPQQKSSTHKQLQPPLTPMIDVTFQLLLYFLLTSTFRKDEGQIPASLPGSVSEVSDAPLRPVRLVVTADGYSRQLATYTVDNCPPTVYPNELFRQLENRAAASDPARQPVIIKSDGLARWEYVVEAYNAALRAKYKNIAFENDSRV